MSNQLMRGIDWTSIFSTLAPAATARGIAAALAPIAGSMPRVTDGGGYSEISFTPEQEERVSAWLVSQLNKEPGPVRMDMGGIALKVISREYWPYMIGLAVAGGLLGYLVGGSHD